MERTNSAPGPSPLGESLADDPVLCIGAPALAETGAKPAQERPTTFAWKNGPGGPTGAICLRPGLDLVVNSAALCHRSMIRFEMGPAPLELAFHLRGRRRSLIRLSHRRHVEELMQPGQCVLAYLPFCSGTIECLGTQDHLSLTLFMARPFLQACLGSEHGNGAFRHIAALTANGRGNESPVIDVLWITPAMEAVVRQILACPYQGAVARIFIEAKALELVALTLSVLAAPPRKNRPLGPGDLDRVREAHRLLLENLDAPPDLESLAHMAGVNRNKLNRGFRHLFGLTVFEALRLAKLDRALGLLAEGRLNIGQAAHEAGYKSHSHFTNAFAKRFGIPPTAYLKNGSGPIHLLGSAAAQPPRPGTLSSGLKPPSFRTDPGDDSQRFNLLRLIRHQKI